MSINHFDNAMLNKVKTVWDNTIYANTAATYNAVYTGSADATKELKFPLLNIYRPDGYTQSPNQTIAARLQGLKLGEYIDEVTGDTITARFLVVNVAYQIDIYAKTPEDLDNITDDLMHMFSLSPTLTVKQTDKAGLVEYEETYEINYVRGPVPHDTFDNDDRVYSQSIAYELKNIRLINFRRNKLIKEVDVRTVIEGDDHEDIDIDSDI